MVKCLCLLCTLVHTSCAMVTQNECKTEKCNVYLTSFGLPLIYLHGRSPVCHTAWELTSVELWNHHRLSCLVIIFLGICSSQCCVLARWNLSYFMWSFRISRLGISPFVFLSVCWELAASSPPHTDGCSWVWSQTTVTVFVCVAILFYFAAKNSFNLCKTICDGHPFWILSQLPTF